MQVDQRRDGVRYVVEAYGSDPYCEEVRKEWPASLCGGREAALAAALAWRNAKERELGKPRTERLVKGHDATSNTGIIGVARVTIRGVLTSVPSGAMPTARCVAAGSVLTTLVSNRPFVWPSRPARRARPCAFARRHPGRWRKSEARMARSPLGGRPPWLYPRTTSGEGITWPRRQ